MFLDINRENYEYFLSKRISKLIAIILTASSIAFSSLIFQTITNNKILTPSVLGLDSLYILIQTVIVFILGQGSIFMNNPHVNFLVSVAFMILFSMLLFKLLLGRESNNIFFLLLTGIIFGTLFKSLSSYMQFIIDPNEFLVIQGNMFASFNNINTNILAICTIILIAVIAYVYSYSEVLDVISLGREEAINLGIDYDKVLKRMLFIVCLLVSVSTALAGPLTFLGLLVVNITYQFIKTYKHKYLMIGSMLISIVLLIGGQLVVEKVLNFNTTLSVIINFIGGVYFIYILLKESKQ